MARQRLFAPDLLKAVAIFGVVLIHSAHLLVPQTDMRSALLGMARFAVPAFILLWAYFFELGYARTKSPRAYARQRFVGLLIPYAFWTFFYVMLLLGQGHTIALADLKTGYWSGYGWPGQYYFIILFQLIFLFPLLRRGANAAAIVLILIVSCALYAFAPESTLLAKLSDRVFFYWIPYVAVGVWLARNSHLLDGVRRPALVALGLGSMLIIPLTSDPSQSFSPYVLPAVLAVGVVMPFAVLLAHPRGDGALQPLMSAIGKRTLGIFCVNPLVITILGAFIPEPASYGPAADIILSLAAAALVVALSLGLTIGIAATPLRRIVQG